MLQYGNLLEAGGYKKQFEFDENHQAAYIFLRQVVSYYTSIENRGDDITILQPPLGAEEWIILWQRDEAKASCTPNEFKLDLTDEEKELLFNESKVLDEDGMESDREFSDDMMDDGFILNI